MLASMKQGLCWRQYLLHVTGLRRIRQVTGTGLTGEGPGSQVLMIMNAINFAGSCGLTYVHTPFTLVEHGDRPMVAWAKSWEALFNLGVGETICGVDRHEAVNFSHNFNELDALGGAFAAMSWPTTRGGNRRGAHSSRGCERR